MSSRSGRPPAPDNDGRRLRWQAHREARRKALIDAAIRAVRHHGPNAGMDQIAAEAKTSKPVVYRYFTDKADLYLAIGQRVAQGLVDRITAAVDDQPDGRSMVAAGIDAFLRAIEEEPALYRFVVNHTLLDRPVEKDPVVDYSTLLGSFISRRVGDQMREVGMDSGAAEPWGFAMVGMVRAAGEWWLDRQSMSRQALGEYLTVLVWDGLASNLQSVRVESEAEAKAKVKADATAEATRSGHPSVRLLRSVSEERPS
jgi:AcrR family transcriptional regulator